MCIQWSPKCQQLADTLQSREPVDREETPAHPPIPIQPEAWPQGPQPSYLPCGQVSLPAWLAQCCPPLELLPASGTVLLCCVLGWGKPSLSLD